MQIRSDDLSHNMPIPGRCAFGVIDPQQHVALSDNRNPHLTWSNIPEGTQSFVICCIDTDVPTKADDVNQEGRVVPAELPRTEFVHWLIADIPAGITDIDNGRCSKEITAGGKSSPAGPDGSVQGVNDYTAWFAGDADMAGTYLGYDGPCPPWNDSLVHHYHFTVYAVDQESLNLPKGFDLTALRKALEGRVLGEATLTATYSLNPAVPA
ncbi:MAG: YbhB/YbcL family Raf kinase inhibitor-like protein [Oceanococcus sp.]